MKRDYKISIIRILAMIAIVLCHIFQSQQMNIAFWLNVGVQVFLFMSGFLYGKKNIEDTWSWIKRQFSKILIPYYIYVLIILLLYIISARNVLTIKNIISLICCLPIFPLPAGLGHLWFIPVILICYLMTPLLQKLLKQKSGINKLFFIVAIIGIVEIFSYLIGIGNNIRNIMCYVLGYLLSSFLDTNKKEKNILSISIIILAIIFNSIKIFIIPSNYNIILSMFLKIILDNSHILLGSAIFIILYKLLELMEKHLRPWILKIINEVDKNCFYIYITHHIFILGPLAIINLTNNLLFDIIIVLCCIVVTSYLLGLLTNLVKKGVKKT